MIYLPLAVKATMGHGESKNVDATGQSANTVIVENEVLTVHNDEITNLLKVIMILQIVSVLIKLLKSYHKFTKKRVGKEIV